MKTLMSPWIVVGILIVACLVGVAFFGSTTQANRYDCTPSCGLEKATTDALNNTAAMLTAEAIPTEPGSDATPVPIEFSLTPTNVIKIRRLEGDDRIIPGMDYNIVTDIWIVGSVEGAAHRGTGGFFILTRRPFENFKTSSIGYYLWGTAPGKEWNKYYALWTAPTDIGEIMITSITAPDGIVAFTTSTGVAGTFDLAKKVWSLK